MRNVVMSREGDVLVVKVGLAKTFGPSRSGKTTVVASTEGNIAVPGDNAIKVGLNVYRKQ
jgi:hypothetical protein